VKFCPRDGSLLLPVRRGGRAVLRCPRCGYEEDTRGGAGYRSRASVENRSAIVVLAGEAASLPRVKTRGCPRCGHDEAYFWAQQTRAADEPPTRFYRCVKCGHTWREYE
jgi:DNA-directed RNA polymerase subunit M